jgi:hypothetical protein
MGYKHHRNISYADIYVCASCIAPASFSARALPSQLRCLFWGMNTRMHTYRYIADVVGLGASHLEPMEGLSSSWTRLPWFLSGLV